MIIKLKKKNINKYYKKQMIKIKNKIKNKKINNKFLIKKQFQRIKGKKNINM